MKLHDGPKYLITERLINSYIWQLNLTIRNIQKADFGEYTCTSVNALGKQDARIRLQGKLFLLHTSYIIHLIGFHIIEQNENERKKKQE